MINTKQNMIDTCYNSRNLFSIICINYKWHICDALRDLIPFVQFKKREKHPWRSVNFSKVAGFLHGYFSRFLNCKHGTESRNAPHLGSYQTCMIELFQEQFIVQSRYSFSQKAPSKIFDKALNTSSNYTSLHDNKKALSPFYQ